MYQGPGVICRRHLSYAGISGEIFYVNMLHGVLTSTYAIFGTEGSAMVNNRHVKVNISRSVRCMGMPFFVICEAKRRDLSVFARKMLK